MGENVLADLPRRPGLATLAADLQNGDLSPKRLVSDCYDRLDETEAHIEAWVDGAKSQEWVEAEAAALADRHPDPGDRPPLFGVPVGVKDIFHVDGLPTKAGSDLPPGGLAGEQATVVDDLRAAGALVMGKTVTTAFAHAAPGPTRNPHDTDHTPGGSSSGSAAAVAAGVCPLALGTQTIGSVIRPAAFCGVVGYKPSYGRIPTAGVLPYSDAVDHVGLFTRDVPGVALGASIVCDGWRSVDAGQMALPAVGVPDDAYLAQASESGLKRFERVVDALTAAGYEVERITAMDDIAEINERHKTLISGEAADVHHDRYEAHGDLFREETAALVERGRDVTAEELAVGRRSRGALRDRLHDRMAAAGVDVWVAPGACDTAPEGIDSTGDTVMNLPWTHAGLPTVALPAGRADGLPYGVQFASAFGTDERLLAWGERLADTVADAV
jgi:Asp-tRNA(Asn)/Glu-tRNA(Gln) amidotransferase A subunit family amidase